MLNAVITWSLRHRLVVVLGGGRHGHGRPRVSPAADRCVSGHDAGVVQVNTVAPLETERQIAARVEQTISGLPGLEEVRSTSSSGAPR